MATHNATHQMKTLCSTCSLRELCLPVGLMPNEFLQLDAVIRQSRRLKKASTYFVLASRLPLYLPSVRASLRQQSPAKTDGIR